MWNYLWNILFFILENLEIWKDWKYCVPNFKICCLYKKDNVVKSWKSRWGLKMINFPSLKFTKAGKWISHRSKMKQNVCQFLYFKRFAQSAGPGSQKAWTWKLGWCQFRLFFDHRRHFGSPGGQLFMPKGGRGDQRCPKRRHPRNKVIFWDRFGGHFLSIFWFFGICF